MVNIRNASSYPFHIFDCHFQQARRQRNHGDIQRGRELRPVAAKDAKEVSTLEDMVQWMAMYQVLQQTTVVAPRPYKYDGLKSLRFCRFVICERETG
jgi:hypothetical protein